MILRNLIYIAKCVIGKISKNDNYCQMQYCHSFEKNQLLPNPKYLQKLSTSKCYNKTVVVPAIVEYKLYVTSVAFERGQKSDR